MPTDMDIIRKARALMTPNGSWMKGEFEMIVIPPVINLFYEADRQFIDLEGWSGEFANDPWLKCFCLDGALIHADIMLTDDQATSRIMAAETRVADLLQAAGLGHLTPWEPLDATGAAHYMPQEHIYFWNDAKDRVHRDVLDLLDVILGET